MEIELKHERHLRAMIQDQLKLANAHIEFLTKLTKEPLKTFGADLLTDRPILDGQSPYIQTSSPVKSREKTETTLPSVSTGTTNAYTEAIQPSMKKTVSIGSGTTRKDQGKIASGMSTQTETKGMFTSKKPSRAASRDARLQVEKRDTNKEDEKIKVEFEKKMSMITQEIKTMNIAVTNENSQRFTDAMTRVTDLLKVNQMLRDENNAKEDMIRKSNIEMYQLREESEDLRDRIELLETIVQSD